MFCPKCGRELPAGSQFCPDCGNKVSEPTQSTPPPREPEPTFQRSSVAGATGRPHITKFEEGVCPKCGSHDCEIQVQQNISGSSKGYSVGTGCLGFLLAGPFGLLCGLCGSGGQTTTTHQSVWVCKQCGNQFLPRSEIVKSLSSFGFLNGFILGIGVPITLLLTIIAIVDKDISEMKIPIFVALVTAGLYYISARTMHSMIGQYGGTSPKEFFTSDEYASYKKSRRIGLLTIPVLIVVITILVLIFA